MLAGADDLGLRLGQHAGAGYEYWIFAMQDLIAAPDDPWIAAQDDGGSVGAGSNNGPARSE